jgi:hypothetical protein
MDSRKENVNKNFYDTRKSKIIVIYNNSMEYRCNGLKTFLIINWILII